MLVKLLVLLVVVLVKGHLRLPLIVLVKGHTNSVVRDPLKEVVREARR